MTIQAILDTSILVAAGHSKAGASFELLRLFDVGDARWEWNISTALMLEYEDVLKREEHRQGRDLAEVDRMLDDVCARANRHSILYRMRPHLSDPDDEFILELALAAGADYIVTHNLGDFRDAVRFGIRVVRPGEFLQILRVQP
jgi:predicted nucleic acid-binding protein